MNQTNNVRSATPSAQIKLYQQYHSYSKARASTIPIMVNMDQSLKTKDYPIGALIFAEYNPRQLTKDQYKGLRDSIERFGLVDPIIVNKHKDRKNIVVGGHQRIRIAQDLGFKKIPCVEVDLDPDMERELNIRLNRNTGEWDWDALANYFDVGELTEWGFTNDDLQFWTDEPTEGLIDDDEIPEVEEAITKSGDLWLLGEHRVLCGDATKKEDVERLMEGQRAELLHADPPYGMGKEKDGIINDNLYREKLDAFQMDWWESFRPYLEDNGSAYIWGNAEDLWRLWYAGGLKDSERLTFRNEIIWDQGNVSWGKDGMSGLRKFAPMGERCLFFMLGEQGFNNNADNYWDGWETIRNYLLQERLKMGWDIPTMKTIAGHSDKSRDHWTSKSQWSFPTREVYESFQRAAKDDAFKKECDGFKKEYDELKQEYDELKQEFYSTRAYFNNTHDNMTDVWQFERVQGEERHGHATPKPVEMIERIIKSSSQEKVIEPFLGSGSTLIACEKTSRKCYGMEIDPHYCDVIVKRWEEYTGNKAERIEVASA